MTRSRDRRLVERLVDFAVGIIALADSLPDTRTGNHIRSQLLRSGTSAAPNYAEAQSAESRGDFIHKLKIALKELRETEVWLMVIAKSGLIVPSAQLEPLRRENDELIAILVASVNTATSANKPAAP